MATSVLFTRTCGEKKPGESKEEKVSLSLFIPWPSSSFSRFACVRAPEGFCARRSDAGGFDEQAEADNHVGVGRGFFSSSPKKIC